MNPPPTYETAYWPDGDPNSVATVVTQTDDLIDILLAILSDLGFCIGTTERIDNNE